MTNARISTRLDPSQALASSTPILTTQGWKTLATVTLKDQVYTITGEPAPIKEIRGPWVSRPCYETLLSNGQILITDEAYQWATLQTLNQETSEHHTTLAIAESMETGQQNHFIRNPEPLIFQTQNLATLPNMPGNAIQHELLKRVNSYHEITSENRTYMAEITAYLPAEQKESILNSFLDPMNQLFLPENQCYRGEISKQLAKELSLIAHTLGMKTTEEETGNPRTTKLIIYPRVPETDENNDYHHANNYTEILSTIPTETVETISIRVDHPTGTYLIGETLTPSYQEKENING